MSVELRAPELVYVRTERIVRLTPPQPGGAYTSEVRIGTGKRRGTLRILRLQGFVTDETAANILTLDSASFRYRAERADELEPDSTRQLGLLAAESDEPAAGDLPTLLDDVLAELTADERLTYETQGRGILLSAPPGNTSWSQLVYRWTRTAGIGDRDRAVVVAHYLWSPDGQLPPA